MKNPLKRIQSLFSPGLRRKDLDDPRLAEKVNADECDLIWPDGTWRSHLFRPSDWLTLDNTVRAVLLRAWAMEALESLEKSLGWRVNPGMFGGSAMRVPQGWRPSTKLLKHLWTRDNMSPESLHYVLAQLRNGGHLAA
jgi:hypothetical protein